MALQTCPECGGEVSDRANACPHCGYRSTSGLSASTIFVAITIGAVVLAWALPSAYYGAATPCGWLARRIQSEVSGLANDAGVIASAIGAAAVRAKTEAMTTPECLSALGRLRSAGSTVDRYARAALSSDLKNLASMEEVYFYDHNRRYASDLATLGLQPSEGNSIDLRYASELGWAAVGGHPSGLRCAIYSGTVPSSVVAQLGVDVSEPGRVVCAD